MFYTFVLESVQLLCFCFREFPGFAAIHQNCSYIRFEQLNLRLPAKFASVPNSSQPVERLVEQPTDLILYVKISR